MYVNFLPFFNFICAIAIDGILLLLAIHFYSNDRKEKRGAGGKKKQRGNRKRIYLFLFVPIFFFFFQVEFVARFIYRLVTHDNYKRYLIYVQHLYDFNVIPYNILLNKFE